MIEVEYQENNGPFSLKGKQLKGIVPKKSDTQLVTDIIATHELPYQKHQFSQ